MQSDVSWDVLSSSSRATGNGNGHGNGRSMASSPRSHSKPAQAARSGTPALLQSVGGKGQKAGQNGVAQRVPLAAFSCLSAAAGARARSMHANMQRLQQQRAGQGLSLKDTYAQVTVPPDDTRPVSCHM
jgi:hypothetical protein